MGLPWFTPIFTYVYHSRTGFLNGSDQSFPAMLGRGSARAADSWLRLFSGVLVVGFFFEGQWYGSPKINGKR